MNETLKVAVETINKNQDILEKIDKCIGLKNIEDIAKQQETTEEIIDQVFKNLR